MNQTIVLCGFMGCGKSATGRRLSQYTGRQLIDTDRYIEEKTGKTVSQIFVEDGEPEFRRLETEAVRELAALPRKIISVGGGLLLTPGNAEIFRENHCHIVLIDTPMADLQLRLRNDVKRPLLQQPNREQVIRDLHAKRIDRYREASTLIVSGEGTLDAVAHRILVATGILTEDHFHDPWKR